MAGKTMRLIGILCLVVCAVCVYVAIERYQANAGNVAGMNAMMNGSPLGGMMGNMKMTPGVPAVTKYFALLALLSGIGGVVLLVNSKKAPNSSS